MNMYRFGQQWINLDHVAHINVNLPVTGPQKPSHASIEITFSNGGKLEIKDEWKDMSIFSKVLNPFVDVLGGKS